MDNKKSDLVVKSNEIINGSVDLTLQQQRFIAFIASQLPKKTEIPSDRPFKRELCVAKFAELFNLQVKHAYSEIEKHASELQRKIIQLRRGNVRIKVGIVAKTYYYDNEGRVEVTLDEDVLPHFMDLYEKYTEYRIKDIYQFKSANTWRIYELLAQYRQAGKREMTLDDIRFALGVEGKYTRSADLKNIIIRPAINEINKHSDLQVEYETMKRGRRVTGYCFHIHTKSKERFEKDMQAPDTPNTNRSEEGKEMVALLMGYNVGGKQAGQLSDSLKGKGLNWLQSKLPKMQADFNKLQDQKTNLGGYIYKALKKELSGQLQMPIQEDSGSGKGADEQGQNYIRQAVSAVDKNSGPAKGGWGNLYDSDKQHYKDLARGEMIRIYGGEPPENLVEQRAKNIFNGK